MSRPRKCRRICVLPETSRFGPLEKNISDTETIILNLDEYETIRLIDLLGLTQEECARQMDVARTTVQAMYNTARQKLAASLVEGRPLHIEGGNYTLCSHAASCCGKNCSRHGCSQKQCETNGGCKNENCCHL